MNKSRSVYFISAVIIIIAGLLSRHFTFIPLFVGDVLWAVMVYLLIRFLWIHRSIKFALISSLLFCYSIEISQLYTAPWIDALRHTLPGRLVLGQGFLWTDLICYTLGVGFAALADAIKPKLHKSFYAQ